MAKKMTDQDHKIPGASYLTFRELFRGGRSFEIPDYQRAYDWGKVQRDDLLGDIDRLDRLVQEGDGTVSHFCGTVHLHAAGEGRRCLRCRRRTAAADDPMLAARTADEGQDGDAALQAGTGSVQAAGDGPGYVRQAPAG